MKYLRPLVRLIMPLIFICAMAPLVYHAYTKTPANLFPTPEQQATVTAFADAKQMKEVAFEDAVSPRETTP